MPDYVKSIHKTYKDYVKIIVYDNAWTPTMKTNKNTAALKITEKNIKDMRNVMRARTSIHDIIACNTFEFFVTLTVSPEAKFNRYDYDECAKHLSNWLKRHLPKYILVPEKHKDGAYHFHLLADVPKVELRHYKGSVFNLVKYKYGYSTAIKIRKNSEARIANYVRKYITKDLLDTVGKGRRRYWTSKNLIRPIVEYNAPLPPTAELKHTADFIKVFHSPLKEKKHD